MKILSSKTKMITTVFLLLMMSSVIVMAANNPLAKAQATGTGIYVGAPTLPAWPTAIPTGVTPNVTVATTAFISLSPNPIGIGQAILVNLWMEPATHYARYLSGFTVTFTKPDGSTVNVGPLNSYQGDTTAWFTYPVDQVGTWKAKFDFVGNYFPAGLYYNGKIYDSLAAILQTGVNPNFAAFSGPTTLQSAYYQGASTPEVTFTVQQDMVASWPPAPLPTDYWTRPIPIENREWWVIGGQYPFASQGGGSNWPANTNTFASNYKFTPYVQAPNTAHIVWRREGALGGIAGGQYGYRSVGSGEGTYAGTPNIIFQGRAYQTINKPMPITINGSTIVETTSVWQCYDLRTGKVYWEQTGITQPPTVVTYNTAVSSVPGAEQTGLGTGSWSLMYIGSRLIKYDPWSGAVTLNISLPVSSGTYYNEPFVLSVQTINATTGQYRLINWTTTGTDANFTNRIMSNITWPFSAVGTADYESMISVSSIGIIPAGAGNTLGQVIMGANLVTGNLLWNITTNDSFAGTGLVADHGKLSSRIIGGWFDCWDLSSGKLLWQSAKPGTPGGEPFPWGDFGSYTIASYGGLIYDFGYAGFYALDWNTGSIVWNFTTPGVAFEEPWYPSMSLFSNSPQIADGKLYYANGEHSPTEPLSRGWKLWCFNATTGQELWKMEGGGSAGAIADGYLTYDNRYDGYMYVFGKGQSSTTISAPQTAVPMGTGIIIQGTVMDMSPGNIGSTTSSAGSTTQPGTVPCVSAASIETEMEYLYMQQSIDGMWHNETITGVPVTLTAIDSTNNVIDIGTTITNGYYGTFGYTWIPPHDGQYTVTASFAGDDSYGSSSAATTISVNAATATPTPTSTAAPSNFATTSEIMTYFAIGVVAIIISIAIVGVLILRKH